MAIGHHKGTIIIKLKARNRQLRDRKGRLILDMVVGQPGYHEQLCLTKQLFDRQGKERMRGGHGITLTKLCTGYSAQAAHVSVVGSGSSCDEALKSEHLWVLSYKSGTQKKQSGVQPFGSARKRERKCN